MAFGGSIKLEGETEYKKALAGIMQTYKELQSELKLVTSQYDKNDKSQDALKAKAEAMNKLLEQQKAKLDLLNDRYAELNKLAEQQRSNIQSLTDKYRSEVSVLEELERSVGKSSDEYKKQESVVRDLENQIDKETKANEQTETAMSKLRVEMNNTQTEANKTGREMDNLGKETEEAGEDAEKAANGGFTVLKGIIANLASEAISKAVEGVKTLASKLVDVGKQSYNAFAEYEQLVGGVETLYGESAGRLEEYAKNAYKTAGVSANKYMEQATSFAATLLQGLEGDTEKAVDYADMAIKDMADNANKMGTNISMIQNAYQGFAKDNYTMLDNLKLGYGGTAGEMARLINEMKVLGVNEKGELLKEVNSETVKNVGLDKIIEAIHLVQQQLGITGTTAKEAEGTITGSMGQVAAAFENLKVAFASGNNNEVREWVETLTVTLETMLKNAIPRIKNVITGMWTGIKTALRKNLPGVANELIPFIEKVTKGIKGIFDFVTKNSKQIIGAIKGIVTILMGAKIVDMIVNATMALHGFLAATGPIGVMAVAIGALVVACSSLKNTFGGLTAEQQAFSAQVDETIEKIDDQIASWDNLKESQSKYASEELSKIDQYEALWEELKKITDENGNIKEGYEDRAKFIAGELSDALGVEILINQGVVEEYEKLTGTIDTLLEKQRAQTIMNVQRTMAENAMQTTADKVQSLLEAQAEIDELEKQIQHARNVGITDEMIADYRRGAANNSTVMQLFEWLRKQFNYSDDQIKQIELQEKRLSDLATLQEQQQTLEGQIKAGYVMQAAYEENYAKFQAGQYDEMIDNLDDYIYATKTSNGDLEDVLEARLDAATKKATLLKELAVETGNEIIKAYADEAEELMNSIQHDLDVSRGLISDAIDDINSMTGQTTGGQVVTGNMFSALAEGFANIVKMALDGTKVEMDGEEMGIFVANTVTRAINTTIR